MGIRVDYLSPTLYATDLLILALFLFWLKRQPLSLFPSPFRSFPTFPSPFRRGQGEVRCDGKKTLVLLFHQMSSVEWWWTPKSIWLVFFLYLLINILLSNNPLLGLYGFGKIMELFFLGYYVSKNIKSKKELGIIAAIFSITVIGESLLAIAQYIHQGSINGFLYFLGERKFTAGTPGIANASINGQLILRPYGTFPHPNVLAGFLLCSLIFIYAWFDDKKDTKKKILKTTALLLGSIALFLTLSRITIVLWLILTVIAGINWLLMLYNLVIPSEVEESHSTKLGRKILLLDLLSGMRSLRSGRFRRPAVGMTLRSGSWLFKQIKMHKKTPIIFLAYFCLLALITGALFYIPVLSRLKGTNFAEEAFSQRADLFKSALIIIKDHPLFGVGLHNFIPSLSHIQKPLSPTLYLQPVHNIFLLITAEIGIIGSAFFLWFLFKTYNRLLFYLSLRHHEVAKQSLITLLILSAILILGLFDHYWLTLQQGQLLLALILGLCWVL